MWKENRKKLREQTNEMSQIARVHELTERFCRYGRIIGVFGGTPSYR